MFWWVEQLTEGPAANPYKLGAQRAGRHCFGAPTAQEVTDELPATHESYRLTKLGSGLWSAFSPADWRLDTFRGKTMADASALLWLKLKETSY
jgi:hypothetical protein